jgi:GNAT superfamily N-acetyltransferase
MTHISYRWRGEFTNDEVNILHADAFEHRVFDDDWQQLVNSHSLGWVLARQGDHLVGFVNVIWDGLAHAWIQDTIVAPTARHRGVGTQLVKTVERAARTAGCEWLHVDFDDHLRAFYFESCGFTPTNAGLIDLTDQTE